MSGSHDGSTMLDVFDPPEGMIGHTAVLMAMSADQEVLEEILSRFTARGPIGRQSLGRLAGFLMLDRAGSGDGTAALQPHAVSGLYELHPRSQTTPARLLHAKVALMRFVHPGREQDPGRIRLVVFTGNFTRASIRDHLELVWCVDIDEHERAPASDRADIGAAAAFLRDVLIQRFYAADADVQWPFMKDLFDLLRCSDELAPATPAQRFIHSLQEPLFDQIKKRFERLERLAKKDKDSNVLVCGSGFFEKAAGRSRSKPPEVLQQIATLPGLSPTAARWVVVAPEQAGALAKWSDHVGWKIIKAHDQGKRRRRLHAKFIYTGRLRGGHLSNGRLYLGSGNLSKCGLLLGPEPRGKFVGNIECGVVFEVPERMTPDAIKQCLFCDLEAEEASSENLIEGQDEPAAVVALAEPPPLWWVRIDKDCANQVKLGWRSDGPALPGTIRLCWESYEHAIAPSADVLTVDAAPLKPYLTVKADQSQQWTVPVIDGDGLIARVPPHYQTIDDALDALLAFPISQHDEPSDDESEPDHGDRGSDDAAPAGRASVAVPSFPMRDAARFIEEIATKQADLHKDQIDAWITHLRATLEGIKPDHPSIVRWQQLKLPVFKHLANDVFAPRPLTEKQAERYRETMTHIAQRWGDVR